MKPRSHFKCLFIPVIFLGFLFVVGSAPLSAMTDVPEETAIKKDSIMPAKELYDAFKNNEAEAIKQYANQTMTITGFVVYVGPDVYALPSIELSEKKGGKSRVLCVLPFSDYMKLRKISKGEEVEVTGEARGFYEKGDQVVMKQCVIEKKK